MLLAALVPLNVTLGSSVATVVPVDAIFGQSVFVDVNLQTAESHTDRSQHAVTH